MNEIYGRLVVYYSAEFEFFKSNLRIYLASDYGEKKLNLVAWLAMERTNFKSNVLSNVIWEHEKRDESVEWERI